MAGKAGNVSNPLGKGGFQPLPRELQIRILSSFNALHFRTLSQIAVNLGVSKATVIKYRDDFVKNGLLSRDNWHVVGVRKPNPKTEERLARRQKEMRFYVFEAARAGRKVSANELQEKFGGEKRVASELIGDVMRRITASKRLSKEFELRRRTKSDQPYAKKIASRKLLR